MQEKTKKTIELAKKRIEEIDNDIDKLLYEKQSLELLCQNLMNIDNVISFKNVKYE